MMLQNCTEFAVTILYQVRNLVKAQFIRYIIQVLLLVLGTNIPQCSAVNICYIICAAFVLIAVSHFLGESSFIYDIMNPDWAPNQNLGYDFRGVSASSQE